jgi:predicted PurR-regulated permease PerM
MKTSLNFTAYLIYLPVVIALTWYVAHILFKNSKIFMLDIFNGRAEIANSTNKLFETGFYLLNLGFALTIMQIATEIGDNRSMLEILSTKIGGFSIYLGIMLFFNLYLFFRGKRVARQKARLAEAVKVIG